MSKYEESKEQNKQYAISGPCSFLLFFPKALRTKKKIKYVLTKTKLFTLLFSVTACCPHAPPAGVFMELHHSPAYLSFSTGFSNNSLIVQLYSPQIETYCKNLLCTIFAIFCCHSDLSALVFCSFALGNKADTATCWLDRSSPFW